MSIYEGEYTDALIGTVAIIPGADILKLGKYSDEVVDASRLADFEPDLAKAMDDAGLPPSASSLSSAGKPLPEATFIGTPSGVSVHASQKEMVDSILKNGATPLGPTTNTTEAGQMFLMQTPGGPMQIRVMEGRPNGGPLQGPRTVITRPGTLEYVQPNGNRIEGAVPKADRKAIGHIHGQRP
jgi:hypothetical protein